MHACTLWPFTIYQKQTAHHACSNDHMRGTPYTGPESHCIPATVCLGVSTRRRVLHTVALAYRRNKPLQLSTNRTTYEYDETRDVACIDHPAHTYSATYTWNMHQVPTDASIRHTPTLESYSLALEPPCPIPTRAIPATSRSLTHVWEPSQECSVLLKEASSRPLTATL